MERVSASPSKKRKGAVNLPEDEEITVKIDPHLLHCGICASHLDNDGHVFQCANGHVMCSGCATKYGESCPDCLTADVNRCIALEHIVDGLRTPCPFSASGCKEFVSRGEKSAHEAQCFYAPSACLVPGCAWSGLRDCVADHVRGDHCHLCGIQGFHYNKQFSFCLGRQEPLRLLRGKDGSIFALLARNTSPESLTPGSMIRAVRVQQSLCNASMYEYDLELKSGRSSIALKSVPEEWRHAPSAAAQHESAAEFLFVPRHFGGGSAMNVTMRIRKI